MIPTSPRLTKAFLALEAAGAGAATALSAQLGPAIGNFDIGALEALGVSLQVSRDTGIPITTLLQTLINQSPRIAEVFPTFEDAALAIGLFYREGVPAERALIGFSTALKELTKEEAVALLDNYRAGLVNIDEVLKFFGEEGGRAVAKLAQSDSWEEIKAAILGTSDAADMLRENGTAAVLELVRVAEENVDPFARAMQQFKNAIVGPASAAGFFLEGVTRLAGGDTMGAEQSFQASIAALIPDNLQGQLPLASALAPPAPGRSDGFTVPEGQYGAGTNFSSEAAYRAALAATRRELGGGGESPLTQIIIEGSVIDREGLADAVYEADQTLINTGRIPAFENAR